MIEIIFQLLFRRKCLKFFLMIIVLGILHILVVVHKLIHKYLHHWKFKSLIMIYVLDSHFSTGHTSPHTLKTLEASQELAFVVCVVGK